MTLITPDGVFLLGVIDGAPVYTAWSRRADPQWLADQLKAERIVEGATVLPGVVSSQVPDSRTVHVAPSTVSICLRAIRRIRRWPWSGR